MKGRELGSPSQVRAPAPAEAGAGRVSGGAFRGWRAGSASALAGVGALLVIAAAGAGAGAAPATVAGLPYRDGPPPGFSGGFGEDTCQGCHFEPGIEVNAPGGSVTLAGVPERYARGERYLLTVTLARPGMRVGGFELTARFAEGGAQAGALAAPEDEMERVRVTTDRGVEYAHQRLPGSALAAPDTARWTVLWTAPAQGGAVTFNVAANAANEDDSSSGDYIHTAEAKTAPPGHR